MRRAKGCTNGVSRQETHWKMILNDINDILYDQIYIQLSRFRRVTHTRQNLTPRFF